MNKRFTYLIQKYLDHNLNEKEKVEFSKFLEDPLNTDYLKKAEKAEWIIEEGFRRINAAAAVAGRKAAAAGEEATATAAGEETAAAARAVNNESYKEEEEYSDEEIEEDIRKYGSNISPETREKVRRMHQNMLNRRRDIRRLVFSSAAAAILIGIGFFFLQPSMTSPQKLSKRYYKPYKYVTYMSLIETNSDYNKAIIAYKSFDYSISAQICRELLASETPDAEVYFLYGLNLMELDSMQSAIQQFNAITTFPIEKEGSLAVSAHWYKSLCYLSLGKSDSALRELGMIKKIEKVSINEFDVEGLVGRINRLKRR